MNRYRTYTQGDDPPQVVGDTDFLGVNEYVNAENVPPGQVQNAVNIDFSNRNAVTRGGVVCIPALAASPAGSAWVAQTTAPDLNWYGIAYGNGRFVAVGISGSGNRVMTSDDNGVTWVSRTSAEDNQWKSVVFGGNQFVAVSSNGYPNQIMTSPDGVTWTAQVSPIDRTWNSVAYGSGVYVASSTNTGTLQKFMKSSDGVTWVAASATEDNTVACVTYGNGLFVAVALDGTSRVHTSTNGATWTARTAVSSSWESVTYGNGLFVAVASAGSSYQVMSSPDGITWTGRNAAAAKAWIAIGFGSGVFAALCQGGTGNRVMTSRDGINWSLGVSTADLAWNSVTGGGGTLVAVASSGTGNRVMTASTVTVWATGIYSDPDDSGSQWIMLLGNSSVGFYAFGKQSRSVSLGSYTVAEQSTIVQCNNQVYIFRGTSSIPLYWTGDWSTTFDVAPTPTPASGFETIPYSNQATFYQNRLWVKNGKDTVSASDILDFTTYDQLANSFNINTGSSDFVVTTFPFGENSLVVFKNRSVMLLQNVQGSLADVTATEITRQVGCIGINAVTSVGPDLAYVSDRNVHMLSMTTTNNAVQHKTLPLSTMIKGIMERVNWDYGYKISIAYWDNKLYVALPLDNATTCNAVVVYNFITENWFGEWTFASSISMAILGWATGIYLGLQRLHAVTEDGRIFIMEEGKYDISGATVAEISTSLTTRAYSLGNNNHFQRRMFMDIATNRPKFTVVSYSEGASESSTLLTDQTYSHADSWKFGDTTWTTTNANDDFNRAYRKDYATGPDTIQPGASGILPEMLQELRLPLLTRRQGRLSTLKVTNTQGYMEIRSIGFETREGQRSSLVQV